MTREIIIYGKDSKEDGYKITGESIVMSEGNLILRRIKLDKVEHRTNLFTSERSGGSVRKD